MTEVGEEEERDRGERNSETEGERRGRRWRREEGNKVRRGREEAPDSSQSLL